MEQAQSTPTMTMQLPARTFSREDHTYVVVPGQEPTFPAATDVTDHTYSTFWPFFDCKHCKHSFCSKEELLKHHQRSHVKKAKPPKILKNAKIRCLEEGCTEAFYRVLKLEEHLATHHNIPMDTQTLEFQSDDDFIAWKTTYEENNTTRFIAKSYKESQKFLTRHYRCSRSGQPDKCRGNGLRKQKAQGPRRSGITCTARIDCRILEGGKISAQVCFTHYGHELSIEHIALTKKERMDIANLRFQGVSREEIIKAAAVGSRKVMLTRTDIRNAEISFGAPYIEKHPDDRISVLNWVAEDHLKTSKNNLILFKNMGNEFLLGIMTDDQASTAEEFTKFGVAIDVTRDSEPWKYQLVTLIGFNERRKAFALACLITSRDTHDTLVDFFNAVKLRCRKRLTPSIFLSLDSKRYYQAWQSVMGPVSQKLILSWHVDFCWRMKLADEESETRERILALLNMLQNHDSPDHFKRILDEILNEIWEESPSFYHYFKNSFAQRAEQWAFCYRRSFGTKFNTSLDAIHKRTALMYGRIKKFDRLDRGLYLILTGMERAYEYRKQRKGVYKNQLAKLAKRSVVPHYKIEPAQTPPECDDQPDEVMDNTDAMYIQKEEVMEEDIETAQLQQAAESAEYHDESMASREELLQRTFSIWSKVMEMDNTSYAEIASNIASITQDLENTVAPFILR